MGAEVLVTLLLGVIDRASQISALVSLARSEGRDVTSAELETLRQADDAAKKALDDAIAKAKAEGR